MVRLVRVDPRADPGISRTRAGSGFRYTAPDGDSASAADKERITALVIPPAWTEVWITTEAHGHIQAVGTDDAGRRQYLYHPDWSQRRDRGKYARALALAESLPRARGRVTAALRRGDESREAVLAIAFRMLDSGAIRIGSRQYLARGGGRGLTTLQRRDVSIEAGVVTLDFPAKSGVRAHIELTDEDLAVALEPLTGARSRSTVLAYRRGRRRVPLTPADVNAYIRGLTGGDFTAKDFRTLRGTIAAADALARIGPVETKRARKISEREAVKATAATLGNTPSVARSSYIDPRVWKAYGKGHLLDLTISPETALRNLVEG
ncbi:DNA topoisomerase IB [Microbacterium sp. cx-55]|uniref:DNA topoisomerase IB n=1 Tax=Microbacterium sp. cx-55 TaxID=2875948 RepID=UPI001CBF80E1|nr:DNA topoisomerase IB [Microbacterium sp. cx-55]MBZ4487373.1 DNA topoisomerase IB [Microbacterium sp. cx-55]UGB35393.1 DNA topoisomerase IB [Microbacterium sp. cx-55]